MKHALAVMMLAGMAGGAAWYRFDDAESPRSSTEKIRVPDPGPDARLADFELPALDFNPVEPGEKFPSHLVAERSPRIQTISDEQPFAVSHEEPAVEPAAPVRRTRIAPPRRDEFDPLETERSPAVTIDDKQQSAEGRPISIRRIGQGRYRTLIITGIDGRDQAAVAWSDELADAIEAQPELLQQQEFVIIRAANPDGLANKTRVNSRGVDLNRNFPTRRYRNDPQEAAGSGPASEAETRAMLQMMYEFRPQRVIHLASSASHSVAYVNQSASDVGERLQRKFAIPQERLSYDRMPGSLEEFVESTWNSTVILLQLRGVPDKDVARKLIPAMLAAVAVNEVRPGSNVAPVSTPRREQSRWQSGPTSSPVPTNTPGYQTERRARPVLRRGYEELPPPPQ